MLNPSLELTRQTHREYPILQFELWQQPRLVAGIALILLAFPWGRQLAPSAAATEHEEYAMKVALLDATGFVGLGLLKEALDR